MKKLTLLGITVSALLLSNCSNEEVMRGNDTLKVVELFASVNESDSRASITDQGIFSWSKGDQISVHTSAASPAWQSFTLQGDGGSSSGKFQGTVLGEGTTITSCAVHPADLTPSLSNNQLTLTLPSSYQWKEGVTNVIMMAYIKNDTKALAFKHLGGLFRFVVRGIPATATQFVFTATGKKLAGQFTVSDITAAPVITTSDASDATNSVTINFEASSSITERTFYVPAPTGAYGALKCEIKNGQGDVLTTTNLADSKTVARAEIMLVPTITCTSVEGGIAVNATSKDELSSALSNAVSSSAGEPAKSTTVTVSEDYSKAISDPITIPVSNLSTSTVVPTVTVAFDAIPQASTSGGGQANAPIKITDGTTDDTPASSEKSKATIEIAIPQKAESDVAPSFEVAAPTATAVLSATAATAEYNQVTAFTADNTLVVNKGVTVEELTIKGGSVKIYGTVKKLTIESNSTTKKVLVYPGASCTNFTDSRTDGNQITLSYVPGDSGENEGYKGGNESHEWD